MGFWSHKKVANVTSVKIRQGDAVDSVDSVDSIIYEFTKRLADAVDYQDGVINTQEIIIAAASEKKDYAESERIKAESFIMAVNPKEGD